MTTPSNFKELADILIDLIRTALPVITGLALMVFFWGLAKFIFRLGGDENVVGGGGDEGGRGKKRKSGGGGPPPLSAPPREKKKNAPKPQKKTKRAAPT